jgi:hypothetical protein
MKTFKQFTEEMSAGASVVGTGNIAGAGVGPQGEPGVPAGITATSKRKSDFPKVKSPVMKMFTRKPPQK